MPQSRRPQFLPTRCHASSAGSHARVAPHVRGPPGTPPPRPRRQRPRRRAHPQPRPSRAHATAGIVTVAPFQQCVGSPLDRPHPRRWPNSKSGMIFIWPLRGRVAQWWSLLDVGGGLADGLRHGPVAGGRRRRARNGRTTLFPSCRRIRTLRGPPPGPHQGEDLDGLAALVVDPLAHHSRWPARNPPVNGRPVSEAQLGFRAWVTHG